VPEQTFFRFYLLANPDVATLLYAMAGWSLVGLFFWRWQRGRFSEGMRYLFVLPAVLALAGTAAILNHDYFFRLGVLQTGENNIPLFRAAGETSDHKLADLPSGTIVTWGKHDRGFVRISYPVAGWVPESSLREL
jgi:hypothetical protein